MIALLAWFEAHKKQVALGAIAALAVIFLAMIIVQRQAQKEQSASQALSDVRLPFSSAVAPPAGTAAALAKVADEHRGTKAAARALLLSAGVMFSDAKAPADYAEAQKQFTRVTQEYPESPWQAQAHLGIAAALAAQGKTADATNKYEEINRRFATSPIIDESRLALARLYEGSHPEQAFKLYEELLKGNPQSILAMEANMRQDEMMKLHTNLVALKQALNPPPAPITPPPPIQINPATNRVTTAVSNAVNQLATNVQRVTMMTNSPGATSPVQIQLKPVNTATPSPGAANPAPPTTK
jgi:tetratricopeptide (TPR) repeat protein